MTMKKNQDVMMDIYKATIAKISLVIDLFQHINLTGVFYLFSNVTLEELFTDGEPFKLFGFNIPAFPLRDPFFLIALLADAAQASLAWAQFILALKSKEKNNRWSLLLNALVYTASLMGTAFTFTTSIVLVYFGITFLAAAAIKVFFAVAALKCAYNLGAGIYYLAKYISLQHKLTSQRSVRATTEGEKEQLKVYGQKAFQHLSTSAIIGITAAALILTMMFTLPFAPLWALGAVAGGMGIVLVGALIVREIRKPKLYKDAGTVASVQLAPPQETSHAALAVESDLNPAKRDTAVKKRESSTSALSQMPNVVSFNRPRSASLPIKPPVNARSGSKDSNLPAPAQHARMFVADIPVPSRASSLPLRSRSATRISDKLAR
jgi:hypothetical protein